jgi:hypothetical protein
MSISRLLGPTVASIVPSQGKAVQVEKSAIASRIVANAPATFPRLRMAGTGGVNDAKWREVRRECVREMQGDPTIVGKEG